MLLKNAEKNTNRITYIRITHKLREVKAMYPLIRLLKFFISIILVFISTSACAKETLIFAIDIVRHGDRTPQCVIPKDNHQWQEGKEQLTALGMRQMFQLGSYFREKYINRYQLLPERYQGEKMIVFSTDTDRTLMSAESLLFGLYPLGTGPTASNELGLPYAFQPIPIHTRKNIEGSPEDKKKFITLPDKYVKSTPAWREKTASIKDKLAKWSVATGLEIKDLDVALMVLADTLKIYKLHNIPMPPELSKKDVEEIIDVGQWEHLNWFHTKEIATFLGKSILSTTVGYLQEAAAQTKPLKYALFVDHDTTIESVMVILQKPLDKHELPSYGANLNFSLFKEGTKNYLVKISYNNKPIFLPGCGNKVCNLQEFVKLTNKLTNN